AERRNHIVWLRKRESKPTIPMVTGGTDVFVPIHISLELTRRCNLACSYCYASSNPERSEKELPGDRIAEILSAWIAQGLKGVEITGGEPLLHRDFWYVLDFCVENFSSVALLSNGTLIDQQVTDRLAEYRDKLLLSVSLDGSNAQTHDRISGVPGSFDRALRAIRNLISKGLTVRVAMTVTPENWREIEPTLLLARDVGATWFGWSPVMPFGRGCNVKWNLTCDELVELSSKESKLLDAYRGFVPAVPRSLAFLPPSWNCGIGWKNAVIGPSGLVRPCLLFPEASFSFADLNHEAILEAFQKPIVFRLRNLPTPSDEICGDCRLRIYCTSCPARGLNNRKARAGERAWVQATDSQDLVQMMTDPRSAADLI
ncbi:MAG TPA: radical SAM protein, partial [Firmicutes bacterium]|nr:radical SAM protein [Bacillota bacterium]